MISFELNDKRRERLLRLGEIVTPDAMTTELLSFTGPVIVPIRYAHALYDWLRQGHAELGLGFHDQLWHAEQQLDQAIFRLRTHPAMKGYGMLGRRNKLPMSCWMHDSHSDIPLCNIDGVGTEGFLVPQDAMFDGSRDHYTFWTFVERPHGTVRTRKSMFVSGFNNGAKSEKDSFAAKKAAERKAKFGN